MVCPCNPKAILDANNFTTAGHNMMIDISKESFERAPLDHIILTNLIVPWGFLYDVQWKWVKIVSEYSLAPSTL